MKKTSTTKGRKTTSTPTRSLTDLPIDPCDISRISSTSAGGSDSTVVRCSRNKEGTVPQDDLQYDHNIYMLAQATVKLQEKALSEVTAENELQKLVLLAEVEKKRDRLAVLKKRVEETQHLAHQSELLKREKENFIPIIEHVLQGLTDVESLRHALDCGLPVKGFITESTCTLANTLHESRNMLQKTCPITEQIETVYCETAQEVTGVEDKLRNTTGAQNRCSETSAALSQRVLNESCLKVLSHRTK